jgi:hypothetical protein
MKPDFFHILLERARVGGAGHKPGRHVKWKDAPSKEGMKTKYNKGWNAKQLNENLQPLRRYLRRQVGRPWNKVHSEISEHLNSNTAVQKHILDHLKWEVELHAYWDGKDYFRMGRYIGTYPMSSGELYVDRKGFLRQAPITPKKKYPVKPFEQELCEHINRRISTHAAMLAIHGGKVYRVFLDKEENAYTHWNVARRQHADEDFEFMDRPWGLGRYDKEVLIAFFCRNYDKWRKYKSEYLNHLFNRIRTWERP